MFTPHGRQSDDACEAAIAAGERRYSIAILGDDAPTCRDCGELGERTGHMGCQYPQDHD